MAILDAGLGRAGPGPATEAGPREASLFNPVVDFICLGGGSLVVFLALALLRGSPATLPAVAAASLLLVYVLNFPHFAFSYQIFYRDFAAKAFGPDYPANLRLRYIAAGIVVPLAMIAYFAVAVARGDAQLLGFFANVTLFLVGWHYVKQGYGMLMVDAALKKRFFGAGEKKALLANAYACWGCYWLLANWWVAERDFWGLKYAMLSVPVPVLYVAAGIAILTTAWSGLVLARKWRSDGRPPPLAGLFAYGATLYAWLFMRLDPLFMLLVPACHSLQYITVVWRYQLNVERGRADAARKPRSALVARYFPTTAHLRFAGFLATGILLGYGGFVAAPSLLSNFVAYDKAVFGAAMFIFMFWSFINVHHYFLDNVMWRRGNPETAKYLFAHS